MPILRRPRGWQSLRWRLPVLISALVALVVVIFLWTSYLQVERTLVETAGERAETAADQLGNLIGRSLQQSLAELRKVSTVDALATCLAEPTPKALEQARAVLAPLTGGSSARMAEIRKPSGEVVLSMRNEAAAILPEVQLPLTEGIGPLQRVGSRVFGDIVVPINDAGGVNGAELAGYLLVRRVTALTTTPEALTRLMGAGAEAGLGNRAGDLWTNLNDVVDRLPVDLSAVGVTSYQTADRVTHIAAIHHVEGTPWALAVGFPRELVLAPARTFLQRMIFVAGFFILGAAVIARVVSGRISAPLFEVAAAAEGIAAGDYSRRAPVKQSDEVGRLGEAFNTMAERVAEDMAAREAAESALRDREASFRTLFSANPLPIWVQDAGPSGVLLEVNDAALKHYGYGRDEMLAMTIADIEVGRERPGEPNPARPEPALRRHRLKSGREVDVEVVSHPLTFNGRPASLVVAQDVTARERLEGQLRQAGKMEAVGQLAGGIAHDFNNLLTAILGYTELLLEELPPKLPNRADVEEIRKAGESAASLTRQLLTFSRQQIVEPQMVDLNDVVTRVSSMLKRVIGEHIELRPNLSPRLDAIRADPGQIEQIVMNLAVNARDAMPDGGRLAIQTANVLVDEAFAAQHPGVEPGPHVLMSVSDSGIGMDRDTLSRLFEPFFTTKQRGKGTGLGLPMVYGIVKQWGGLISVYSEPGHGASFKIFLPSASASVGPRHDPLPLASLAGTETILIAEDQPEVRSIIRAILSRHGYTVVTAPDGEAALKVLAEDSGKFDLLLTDVVMPAMGGAELARRIATIAPRVRVLYASGYTDDAVFRQGVVDHGVFFLQKPFSSTTLLTKVREVLASALPSGM